MKMAAVVVLGVAAVVGGSISRAAQAVSPASAQAPACRVTATEFSTHHTGRGFAGDTKSSCRFDRAALEFTCTHTYADSAGQSSVTKTVTKYASVDAVVDEVTVIPPLRKSLRVDSTQQGTSGTTASYQTHDYDAQGRLRREVARDYVTTYTNWDAAGRPTVGSTKMAAASNGVRISYSGMSMTTTTTFAQSSPVMCTQTFDGNGNAQSTSCSGPAGATTGSRTTVSATIQICR